MTRRALREQPSPEEAKFNAEFGEQHLRLGGRQRGHVTIAGPTLTIEAGGRAFPFEWHSYHGPCALSKAGEPLSNQPSARSPFWRAIALWEKQGKRVDEENRALWNEEEETHVDE